jgi:hypothetical protein
MTALRPSEPSDTPRAPLFTFGEALLHPLCLTCAALWWANDNLGKVYVPSWFTGKLSDVASLVVFPLFIWSVLDGLLVLSRGAAWFKRFDWRRRLLQGCAASTGLLFATINVSSGVGDVYRAAWGAFYTLVGGSFPDGTLRLRATHTVDPTDLLTLPALLGALWVGEKLLQRQSALVLSAVTGMPAGGDAPNKTPPERSQSTPHTSEIRHPPATDLERDAPSPSESNRGSHGSN